MDTTKEIKLSIPNRLREDAAALVTVAARLQRLVKEMPAGHVAGAVAAVGERTVANAEALHKWAEEIQKYWPEKDR